jgi:uncharacterized DUF497 family protein
MDFEWDERKRAQIIEERALDFASVGLFFDGRPAIHQPTPRGAEERWKTRWRSRTRSLLSSGHGGAKQFA